MIKRILVVADQEQKEGPAIRKGLYLAGLSNAQLEIIGFCHEDLEGITKRKGTGKNSLKQTIIQHKSDMLEASIQYLRQSDTSYKKLNISSNIVWEKDIHEWVIKRARMKNYDLVVKTGRRSEKAFYTPTDWHLMRSCPAPVYLLTEKKWKKKTRVLVALDVESDSRSKQKLNLQLLKTGRLMADTIHAELDCCFVAHIPKILKDLDAVDVSTYRKKAKEEYLPKVIDMAGSFGITENNIYREIGEPSGCILKIANKLKVDIVVIGCMGRKGISRKLIGNTAEQVLKHLYTDMIVVNLNVN